MLKRTGVILATPPRIPFLNMSNILTSVNSSKITPVLFSIASQARPGVQFIVFQTDIPKIFKHVATRRLHYRMQCILLAFLLQILSKLFYRVRSLH